MLPLILAGAGLLQGMEDSKEAKKAKQAEALRDAAMIRFSPWSGISPDKFAGNNYRTPSATTGGLAGAASFGQTGVNIENSIQDQAFKKQLAEYYKNKMASGGSMSPYGALEDKPLMAGDQ